MSAAQNNAQGLLNHPLVKTLSSQVNGQLSGLDKELSKYKVANDFEARTGVPKAISFLGLFVLFIVLMFFNIFGLASPISTILGFAYPAYLSMQALESPGTADDKQWLTYWITFGSLQAAESIALGALVKYIPFYFVTKSCVCVYLGYMGGAEGFYQSFLRPFVLQRTSRTPSYSTPATNIHEKFD